MSTVWGIFFIGIFIFLIIGLFFRKLGYKFNDNFVIHALTIIFVILIVLTIITELIEGLKSLSEDVRIGHLKDAQYRICLKENFPPEKCRKIVDLK